MNLEYFRIAFRNLRRRRLRSWLTMLGIVIGITAVVALIGMGQGLKVAITSQFGNLGTDKLIVTASSGFGPPGAGAVNPLSTDNLDSINKVAGVKIAAGRLIRSGKLEFNSRLGFGYAASMPDGDARVLIQESQNIEAVQGRLLKDGDTGKVMVGNNFNTQDVGFGKPIVVGSKVIINDRPFTVIGVTKKQGSFILDNVIFMNEDDLRTLLEIDQKTLDAIAVQIQSGVKIDTVQTDIERMLRRERDVKLGEEDFSVQSPQAALAQVNTTLFAIQIFVYVIAGISIVVGGLGIMNTMFTSVLERTRDIGVMKSIGARNSAIFYLFFIESGLIGMIGGLIGAGLGWTLANFLAYLGRNLLGGGLIRAEISIWLMVGSVIGSFLLGSVFGIIPAMRASRLHPVDALRRR
jgi:putative ABC transport system permease protein